MFTARRHAAIRLLVILAACLIPTSRMAAEKAPQPDLASLRGLTPSSTFILSDAIDARSCRDFSPLLARLSPVWLGMGSSKVPDEVRNQHLIIIGQTTSTNVGPLIRELLSSDQMTALDQPGGKGVYLLGNHWKPGRLICVAVGSDMAGMLDAAKALMRRILYEAGGESVWCKPSADVSSEGMQRRVRSLQWLPTGDEYALQELAMEQTAKSPAHITGDQAIADVTYLFDVLAQGYCAYGIEGKPETWKQTQETLVEQLSSQAHWTPEKLAEQIHRELGFVHDCHLRIGGLSCGQHLDFWYDTHLEITSRAGSYRYTDRDYDLRLVSVNEEDPESYLYPSLSATGLPIYRLGLLSANEPEALRVVVKNGDVRIERTVTLQHSEFYCSDRFGQDRLGGVPVVWARSFGDAHASDLRALVQSAEHLRDEPYVILDVRGNGGGNTDWPKRWLASFTGETPAMKKVLTLLTNRTTLQGQINGWEQALVTYDTAARPHAESELDRIENELRAWESVVQEPYWTIPTYPEIATIANKTTLVIVTDGGVASAGEGLLSFAYGQVDNVILVGENSRGAISYGPTGTFALPHSKVEAVIPYGLNVWMAPVREEHGFEPYLWVPAQDAVNCVVAAIRAGTISTEQDIPEGYFPARYTPVWPHISTLAFRYRYVALYAGIVLIGLLLALVLGRLRVRTRRRAATTSSQRPR